MGKKQNSTKPVLGSPLQLARGAAIRNRLFKSAMSEQLGDRQHNPTPGLATLYGRWASGGIGLQMSGNHPHDAQVFAERISSVFAQPFQVGDQQVNLTASIGFSIFPLDTPERDQVLSNAKLAMHRGKNKQRGLICQYHHEMDDTARARRALARDMQLATGRGELELHYQLQTTLADGQICGAEALMRWRHPKPRGFP